MFVPTIETARLKYLLDLLVPNSHHIMFVGSSGTGKTAIMQHKLASLDATQYASHTINMNGRHTGWSLQTELESSLEKKSGMRYGPTGSNNLIYFLDGINLSCRDKYDTQSAIELVRQSIDYHGW